MARLVTSTITGDLTVSSTIYTNTLSAGSIEVSSASIPSITSESITTSTLNATTLEVGNIEASTASIPVINGNLSVSGNLTASENLVVSNDLSVLGNSTISGNLIAKGISAESIEATSANIPTIVGDLVGSASSLNLPEDIGGTSKPVYFSSNGLPVEIGYTIEANVPSGAVFTDTLNTTGSENNSNDVLYFLGAVTRSNAGVVSYTKNNVYMDAAGNINAPSFIATSSKKYKENIKDTEINATSLINKIKVVNFNFISDDEKNPKIGFIAEDTDPLFSTPHQNVMDVTNCIGILLKANQELSKRIEELERIIKEK